MPRNHIGEVHRDILVGDVSRLQAGSVFRDEGGGPGPASPIHGVASSGGRCPGLAGNPWPGQTSALPLSLPSRAWGHRRTIPETSHPVTPEAGALPEFQRSLRHGRGRCREGGREDQARLTWALRQCVLF